MFACYVRNMTLYDDGKTSNGVVGGDARIYQSTFTGTLGSGRLTGGGNVSFNSIWYGGKNIYSDSNYTNCIVYNPSGDANGIYGRADPLFADHTLDGTLCLNSPAFAGGDVPSVDNFGSDYWRDACGDINGKPIAFYPDGRPTLGAFQTVANTLGGSVSEPVGGGWKLAEGQDYGSFRLSEGQSISVVKAASERNCLGIKAGDREFEFGEELFGGSVPKNYVPAVEKGLRECMEKGWTLRRGIISTMLTFLPSPVRNRPSSMPTRPPPR